MAWRRGDQPELIATRTEAICALASTTAGWVGGLGGIAVLIIGRPAFPWFFAAFGVAVLGTTILGSVLQATRHRRCPTYWSAPRIYWARSFYGLRGPIDERLHNRSFASSVAAAYFLLRRDPPAWVSREQAEWARWITDPFGLVSDPSPAEPHEPTSYRPVTPSMGLCFTTEAGERYEIDFGTDQARVIESAQPWTDSPPWRQFSEITLVEVGKHVVITWTSPVAVPTTTAPVVRIEPWVSRASRSVRSSGET